MAEEFPKNYVGIRDRYQEYSSILGDLGKVVRDSGPIEHKNTHLVQLAASAAIRSEGAVHSHAKRALEAGASPEEIYQALLLVTSIIGFPNVAAAISWADDVIQK
ncbi:MAG: carboxymuconolactone decarboxylase family protein [Methanobacteriaceae archaeon]|nr:carboxymuconolactone decarboxylase family protein [Methanobacteriaceae archaeon]MDZ4172800.1 carboxymuconolactone decarboxylase family protein [Methanobacteriaceae archaeon]